MSIKAVETKPDDVLQKHVDNPLDVRQLASELKSRTEGSCRALAAPSTLAATRDRARADLIAVARLALELYGASK